MNILQGLAPGQVVQRSPKGSKILLSGTTSAAGPVWAAVSGKVGPLKGWKKRRVGSASRGKFTARLDGIPAGGPYRLELSCGRDAFRLAAFYVGDVWILAGQSNMQGCGNIVDSPAPHPLVRAFTMRREWRRAVEPITLTAESPDACHNGGRQLTVEEGEEARKNAGKGVGPGLGFGREMARRTGAPQGLICTAHGGTSMEQWTPERTLGGQVSLYGSMLASVEATGQSVAGILWYQGESDAFPGTASVYTERMKTLVARTRRDLKQPRLPWIMVQLARVFREDNAPGNPAWNDIQEQQRLLPRVIPRLGVVAAIDLGLDDSIHISGKSFSRLGARLAREANRLAHGDRREPPAPALKSISAPRYFKRDRATPGFVMRVDYDHVAGGLRARGEPSGFALVDADGRDLRAIYKITLAGNVAHLHLRGPFPDSRLCYGRGVTPVCNITDGRDLALPVFAPAAYAPRKTYLPFVTNWKVAFPLSSPVSSLARLVPPRPGETPAVARDYDQNEFNLEGFVNEHPRWVGREGLALFESTLDLPEPMKLEALMGYDGPFRLWIDGRPVFSDLAGMNPCIPDESRKIISLAAGSHGLQVVMDINRGAAWGFFLRFARRDV